MWNFPLWRLNCFSPKQYYLTGILNSVVFPYSFLPLLSCRWLLPSDYVSLRLPMGYHSDVLLLSLSSGLQWTLYASALVRIPLAFFPPSPIQPQIATAHTQRMRLWMSIRFLSILTPNPDFSGIRESVSQVVGEMKVKHEAPPLPQSCLSVVLVHWVICMVSAPSSSLRY